MDYPSRRRADVAWAVVAAALAAVIPASARADGALLAEGMARMQEADFDAALDRFDRAEAGNLDRDGLVRLYMHRAVVLFALDRPEEMRADLRRALALSPSARPPATSPPPVLVAAARIRAVGVAPPSLEVRAHPARDGVRFSAEVGVDGARLSRGTRLWARRPGSPRWQGGTTASLFVVAPPDTEVLWYAELLGPAGVVLASSGTREAPRHVRAAGRRRARHGTGSDSDTAVEGGADGDGEGDGLTWWIVGGAAAAAALAVAAGVLWASSTGEGDSTQVSGPLVTF